MADEDIVEVHPLDKDTADALLKAAADLDLPAEAVGTSSWSFVVPRSVADKAKLPDHAVIVEPPDEGGTVDTNASAEATERAGLAPNDDLGEDSEPQPPVKAAPTKASATKTTAKE